MRELQLLHPFRFDTSAPCRCVETPAGAPRQGDSAASDQTSHRFVLQRYERLATGKFRRLTLEFSVEALRGQANEMLTYLSDAYAVFHKFYNEQAVETFVHPDT